MLRRNVLGVIVAVLAYAAGGAGIHASGGHGRTLVVTMTNDPNVNQIRVYDAESHVLLQTLSTHGKGGVGGNARGVKQHDGRLVAVVNNGSNSVALFTRDGDVLKFDNVVPTTSAPVSVDFGNDHLYVAGATTVDSFVLHQNSVQGLDGTTALELAGGGAPATGSTSQVGVIGERQLLVTLKTDPDPGTIDIIDLDRGRVSGSAADRGLRPRWIAGALRIRHLPRRHGADHARALESGWAVSERLVYVHRCRGPGGFVLDDAGRQVRLRRQYGQPIDQPRDRDW